MLVLGKVDLVNPFNNSVPRKRNPTNPPRSLLTRYSPVPGLLAADHLQSDAVG